LNTTLAYDEFVVDAGSGSCVPPRRLSEGAEVSVLLAEAGGRNRHPYIQIPLSAALSGRGAGGGVGNRNPVS
jgi:choline dehydrogenase